MSVKDEIFSVATSVAADNSWSVLILLGAVVADVPSGWSVFILGAVVADLSSGSSVLLLAEVGWISVKSVLMPVAGEVLAVP